MLMLLEKWEVDFVSYGLCCKLTHFWKKKYSIILMILKINVSPSSHLLGALALETVIKGSSVILLLLLLKNLLL